jgi:hypothetical protein
MPYFVGNPGTILGQAYKYGGVNSINGIPTLLSSVLNVSGLKIEILHVELLCFVISSVFFIKRGGIFASGYDALTVVLVRAVWLFLVFCFVLNVVCLRPVATVLNEANFSGCTILDCRFGIL